MARPPPPQRRPGALPRSPPPVKERSGMPVEGRVTWHGSHLRWALVLMNRAEDEPRPAGPRWDSINEYTKDFII
eukprot:4844319-Heterocapsa_arctica.AAC.1